LSGNEAKCGMGITRPAQWWLKEVLAGRIDMEEAPESVQSWARLPIFQGACEIIAMDTQDERKAELQKIPLKVRPYVESEVKRLWPMRRGL
jgi:hypothetical protein